MTLKLKMVLFAALFACSRAFAAAPETPKTLVATFSGVISPVAAEYLGQAVEKANSEKFSALVIRLDTPGGLDLSMRLIIKSIMASEVPVILFVSPSGARAASAGVFIAMASHIAAMAPGTNIGAAHPVMIGSASPSAPEKKGDKGLGANTMEEKVLNDASAYMKSIAQQRKRNVDWAIKAVTKSDSISAEEALKMGVIDLIASDTDDLLARVDGRNLGKLGILHTKGSELAYFEPSGRQKFLATISDPNVAMILMSLGAAGLFIELYNPGLILPGVVGAVSLVMAFYSFQTLSANFAGIALILLGMLFLVAEIKIASYGLLAIGGISTILLGALMLFNTPASMGLSVSHSIMASTIGGLVAVTAILAWLVLSAQRRVVVTGVESLQGKRGVAKSELSPSGTVLVECELWNAVSPDGPIAAGSAVEVAAVDGFKLSVRRVS